jgi:hypothetical protein
MRNTADVTGGKPIAVLLQSISGVSANPLVAFYDIHGRKKECYTFVLSRTPHETIYTLYKSKANISNIHHHHHLSRDTSTAGHRPPPKFSTTIGPVLPSSSDFPRPSPDRRSTLWGAYQRCVSRYAVAIRGPFRHNGRQSSLQCALPTAT